MERRMSLACLRDDNLTERSPWLLAAARRERAWSLVGGAAMDGRKEGTRGSVRVFKEEGWSLEVFNYKLGIWN